MIFLNKDKFVFRCASCGHLVHIPEDCLTQQEEVEDRNMGKKINLYFSVEYTCQCGNELKVTGDATEYPVGVMEGEVDVACHGCEQVGEKSNLVTVTLE